MKIRPVAFLLAVVVGICLHAEDKALMEANSILLKASDLETFKVGEAPKFRLEVHFSFLRRGKEDARGSFAREVDAPFLWQEELQFGKFNYRRVRIRKQIWTRQNYDFIPAPVEGLWAALNPTISRLTDSEVVKRINNRKIDGIEARCIEFENVRGNETEDGRICVQADTGYVIDRQYGTREISFSDFSPLGSKVRPRHITVDFAGTDKIVADVNYLIVEEFDPGGFEPIVDGEVSDVCTTSRPPVAKYAPDPIYPLSVRRGSYKGKVIVDVKVGPDGHVVNAAVAQSLQPDLDEAALENVRKWQFEPGTCDGNAVTSLTKVTATYR